jgi:hypothetical protein
VSSHNQLVFFICQPVAIHERVGDLRHHAASTFVNATGESEKFQFLAAAFFSRCQLSQITNV